jgi:hypothetical protein
MKPIISSPTGSKVFGETTTPGCEGSSRSTTHRMSFVYTMGSEVRAQSVRPVDLAGMSCLHLERARTCVRRFRRGGIRTVRLNLWETHELMDGGKDSLVQEVAPQTILNRALARAGFGVTAPPLKTTRLRVLLRSASYKRLLCTDSYHVNDLPFDLEPVPKSEHRASAGAHELDRTLSVVMPGKFTPVLTLQTPPTSISQTASQGPLPIE